MKKILFILLGLILVTGTVFAGIDSLGGVAWTVETKNLSTTTDADSWADEVVWTPDSGNAIVLLGVSYSSALASSFEIETGTTDVIPLTQNTASGVVVIGNGLPIWEGSDDATLTITSSGAAQRSVLLWGYEK